MSASSPTSTHPDRPARVAQAHGEMAAQDPRGLPACHDHIHAAPPPHHSRHKSLESRMLGNEPVRFGGRPRGKGPEQQAPRRAADPSMNGCVMLLSEKAASELFDTLGEWLG